jgi:hypothetical protein
MDLSRLEIFLKKKATLPTDEVGGRVVGGVYSNLRCVES